MIWKMLRNVGADALSLSRCLMIRTPHTSSIRALEERPRTGIQRRMEATLSKVRKVDLTFAFALFQLMTPPPPFPAHLADTEQPSTADPDAFSQLEKTETQLSLKKSQSERLTDLYALSASTTADPYTLSSKLRRSFRAGKKVREQLAGEDADLRNRIGLGERVKLLEGVEGEGSAEWRRARVERERLMVEKGKAREEHPGDSDGEGEGGGNVVVKQLAKVVRGNERRRLDPFGRPPLPATSSSWSPGALGLGRSLPAPRKVTSVGELVKMGKPPLKPTVRVGVGRNGKDRRSASPPPRLQGLVDGYGSDD